MTTLKRNNIVIPSWGGLYGRVLRVTREGLIVVVHPESIMYYRKDEIKKTAYKGGYLLYHPVRFSYMPSLRKLKQQAYSYVPLVWSKPHHKILHKDETISYDMASDIFYHIYINGCRYGGNHFLGERLRDHNVRARYLLDDMLATQFKATYKPNSLRGRNWEILISIDNTNTVHIKRGKSEDILHDLIMMRIAM